MKKLEFDCCAHLPTVKKYAAVVEDEFGCKLQLWVSESVAKQINAYREKHGESCKITIKETSNEDSQ